MSVIARRLVSENAVFGQQKRCEIQHFGPIRLKYLLQNLELSEKVPIFEASECRQRARTICF